MGADRRERPTRRTDFEQGAGGNDGRAQRSLELQHSLRSACYTPTRAVGVSRAAGADVGMQLAQLKRGQSQRDNC